MKKTITIAFLFILSACHQKVTTQDISKLNGYWEIEKVTFFDGAKKEYKYNESFDYFQIKGNKGFRKKMMKAVGFTHVERVPNAMPIHAQILLGRKSKCLPSNFEKSVN